MVILIQRRKKQDAFLALSKRITVLRQELRQKEDQVRNGIPEKTK